MALNRQKTELNKLVQELVVLGEDKDELSLWSAFFDLMNAREKKMLLDNLTKELAELKRML